jgi:predicted esterase
MNVRSTVLLILLVTVLAVPAQVDAKRVYDPSGNPPEEGWPILIYLRGYGVTQKAFDSLVELANDSGIAMVALPVSKGASRGKKARWTALIEPAHAVAQANLETLRSSGRYNPDRVFLAGYAGGGLHAALMVMAYPEAYQGALVASPAVAKQYPDTWDGRGQRNALFLIHAGSESRKDSVLFLRNIWGSGGGQFRAHEYPGLKGENIYWERAITEGLRWIMTSTQDKGVNTN